MEIHLQTYQGIAILAVLLVLLGIVIWTMIPNDDKEVKATEKVDGASHVKPVRIREVKPSSKKKTSGSTKYKVKDNDIDVDVATLAEAMNTPNDLSNTSSTPSRDGKSDDSSDYSEGSSYLSSSSYSSYSGGSSYSSSSDSSSSSSSDSGSCC